MKYVKLSKFLYTVFTWVIIPLFCLIFTVKVQLRPICEKIHNVILYTLMLQHYWYIKTYYNKLLTLEMLAVYVMLMKIFLSLAHTKKKFLWLIYFKAIIFVKILIKFLIANCTWKYSSQITRWYRYRCLTNLSQSTKCTLHFCPKCWKYQPSKNFLQW